MPAATAAARVAPAGLAAVVTAAVARAAATDRCDPGAARSVAKGCRAAVPARFAGAAAHAARAEAGVVLSAATVAARVAPADPPAAATSAAARAAATDRCGPGAARSGASRAAAPAWFAAAAGCAARAGRSAPVAMGALSGRAVRSGARVRRFSARTGVAVQRCAASDAVPWPGAAAAELDGRPVGPWPGGPLVGPLVQLARPFLDAGRTSRCSPRSSRSWRRSKEKLQSERPAET